MKELSLNILDIAENSLKAGAALTEILLNENGAWLTLTIRDNGCGMPPEMVQSVTDPFCTTRTTRKVGLGLPLLKLAAEQTGGELRIVSVTKDSNAEAHGTTVTATFDTSHIDFAPIGDIVSTMVTLIQGHPDSDFLFLHSMSGGEVKLDTRELRVILEGVPLNSYEVIKWIEEYLNEQYSESENK